MSSKGNRYASRAKNISLTLGFRAAAGYLRNRNISLEEALRILVGTH
jgi:hypothetical protein